jgi:hypothetical protein
MRKLKADEIECRVAQVTAKGCSLLLYKTARVDRAILDEEFGKMSWQNDFKVVDGKMYGGIGVYSNDLSEWVWKWDCGTESNTEAEKGQASDCFKRAGFKWGIGVELYTAPFIFIQCATIKDEYTSKKAGKDVYKLADKYTKFEVFEIGYADNGDINKLKIIDDKGNMVFELGKKITQKKKEPETKVNPDEEFYEIVKNIDNIEDLKGYYEQTKEIVKDRKAYHTLVCDRIKAIKGEN